MLDIPYELVARLHDAADKRGMPIEKLLNEFLSQQQSAGDTDLEHRSPEPEETERVKTMSKPTDESEMEYPPDSHSKFAQLARKSGRASDEKIDASARSRDILNTRYAGYLRQSGMSTSELVETLETEYPPGSLARFAQLALKAGMASKERVDTSAHSREILNTEYADYLKKRRASCP